MRETDDTLDLDMDITVEPDETRIAAAGPERRNAQTDFLYWKSRAEANQRAKDDMESVVLALEFYAAARHWKRDADTGKAACTKDAGDRARTVLEAIGKRKDTTIE